MPYTVGTSGRRLIREDYDKSCKDLAVYLLNKIIVRKLDDGCILKGKIVETECYPGGEDKASHSYNGKMTKRSEPMYMAPGTAYVYIIYYRNHCFNISSREPGGVVLIRAVEPVVGTGMMEKLRVKASKNKTLKSVKTSKLCDGPAKLCMSLNITKDDINTVDLADVTNQKIWIEDCPMQHIILVNTTRIGMGKSTGEWANAPFRYYIFKNESVSKRDREAEQKSLITLNP